MEAVQRYYRFQARIYDWTRWAFLFGRRAAVAAAEIRPDDTVLEVGCGTGHNFQYILKYLDRNRGSLTGLDFSTDMLERARRRATLQDWRHVEVVEGDATRMELGRRFDRILFIYSLTMIPDWREALRRSAAHLKPGGLVCIHDFGGFEGWGPLGGLASGWLRVNHVDTRRDPFAELTRLCPGAARRARLGGYTHTLLGRRDGQSH